MKQKQTKNRLDRLDNPRGLESLEQNEYYLLNRITTQS